MSVVVDSLEVAWEVVAAAVAVAMAGTVVVDSAVVAAAEAGELVGWVEVAAGVQETAAEGSVEAEAVGPAEVVARVRAAVAAVPWEVATPEEALWAAGQTEAAMTEA